ncbi:sensor histidine kinase YesM [Paenibacillus turicensis]|uniref:histidine kinase n=1 Tax=Paenibacillus turicensis TaxID=160487 RepID=A0ABS4FMD2_9BACL|nr:ATP-binding protein [Paenibacillus turicensis]MBP1903742.1 sensor histidine kinase YesM [Paenibacillus turicensis]
MRRWDKFLIISVVLLIVTLLYIYMSSNQPSMAPIAKQGVLDLREVGLPHEGLVNLNGEWIFHEGELLTPAELTGKEKGENIYQSVPQAWNGRGKEDRTLGKGVGTLHLELLVPKADTVYGLKINNIRMSHKLFINGNLVGESGSPADSRAQSRPGNTPYTIFFHSNSQIIDIVVQVANHEFIIGGIIRPIQFGTQQEIFKLSSLAIGADLACILIFIMFGAHQLIMYFPERLDRSNLYCGLFLLFFSMGQMLQDEKIFLRLFPNMPFHISYKLLDLSVFILPIMGILFFSSLHTGLFKRWVKLLFLAPLVAYIVAIIVLPYRMYTEIKPEFLIYMVFIDFYIVLRLTILYFRSRKDTEEKKELFLFLLAMVTLMIYLVVDYLSSENILASDILSKLSALSFVMLMNTLMAVRFSIAYKKTEALTHELMLSNQVKDEFLMHTSHEFRTPLHGIMNITSSLLEDDEGTMSVGQMENLWLVKDTAMKLNMLMQDLIDVTKLKHGDLQMHITIVNARAAVQIVLDVLQFELLDKDIALENRVPPYLWVYADENRFRQILYNLVHNSIKHTKQGIISVDSSVRDSMVHLFVQDTGEGIPLDRQAHLLSDNDPFGSVASEGRYSGMGLGLYISRKLVEGMDGEVRLDWTEIGQGTCMAFTLPFAKESEVAIENGTMESKMRTPRGSRSLEIEEQYDFTILIVDDEASNLHTLHTILRKHPYNVLTALSGREALAKISRYPHIDLVILDVMMPEMSGIELCRILREKYTILDLPILFATAKDRAQDIALGFAVGANDYLTKPFDGETLIARIQTLLLMKTSTHQAIQNELAFYQTQIKPHFLYNALSSVISFCYTDGEKAASLLSSLSQYLRYILDVDHKDIFVPLGRELELIDAYVEIEKARFDGRFEYISYVDEKLKNLLIPSLSIQPFVENAIRHGLFDKDGQGSVILTVSEGDHYLLITVEDDGAGISDDILYLISSGGKPQEGKGGIGIFNIRRRLETIPGASLAVSSKLGRGTKVTVYLPMKEAEG